MKSKIFDLIRANKFVRALYLYYDYPDGTISLGFKNRFNIRVISENALDRIQSTKIELERLVTIKEDYQVVLLPKPIEILIKTRKENVLGFIIESQLEKNPDRPYNPIDDFYGTRFKFYFYCLIEADVYPLVFEGNFDKGKLRALSLEGSTKLGIYKYTTINRGYNSICEFVAKFLMFYHFTESTIDILNSQVTNTPNGLPKILTPNDLPLNDIEIINKHYYTKTITSSPFGVRDHFRLYRNTGKLVEIKAYQKHGYTRRSRIELKQATQ